MRAWLGVLVVMVGVGCGSVSAPPGTGDARKVLRFGHFPNLTHVHGLIAHHLSRQGQGWFEARLGDGVRVEWLVYNAGPGAMEALLAESLELTYVGPNPALNAHSRSRGREVRIIAGATAGGAALVVGANAGIRGAADFRGKRVATPQLGNTQDVACRAWLIEQGFRVTLTGGDVHVVPTANPDQLALLASGTIDAAWTAEPWVSRLEAEAPATVFREESDAVTTVLVASARLLREHRDLARKVVSAHDELTRWIVANPGPAQEMVRAELRELTSLELSEELTRKAWTRLRFESTPPRAGLARFVSAAATTGLLPGEVDVELLVEVP